MSVYEQVLSATLLEPRLYQKTIVNKCFDSFTGRYANGAGEIQPAIRSAMIESPTGSGKTPMGLLTAKCLHTELNGQLDVYWVAMRRELLRQATMQNLQHSIGLDFTPTSMFESDLPSRREGRKVMLVVDECLPYEVEVDAIVNGERQRVQIGDVVTKNVGEMVLSDALDGLEYQPITSRTEMGPKEIYEIDIETEEGIITLQITAEGRIWTEEGYVRVEDVEVGMLTRCLASRCQTYLYEQESTQQTPVSSDSTGACGGSPAMQVRLWGESFVGLVQKEVQDLQVQPSPSASHFGYFVGTADANYQGNTPGGWVGSVCNEPAYEGTIYSQITNQAFHQTPIAIYPVATCGIEAALQQGCSDQPKSGVRKRSSDFYDVVAPNYLQNSQSIIPSHQDSHIGLSGRIGQFGICSMVDGRRINSFDLHSLICYAGAGDNKTMAAGQILNSVSNRLRQEGQTPLYTIPATGRLQGLTNSGPARDSASVVQVRQVPQRFTIRGTVVAVRRTGKIVETFDIGVAKNHNFYADNVLVHNCQHDATSTMAKIHEHLKPDIILGMSATPFRTDRVKLCFDRIIRDAGIHQLIGDGYLSPYHHFTLPKWDVPTLASTYASNPDKWGKSVFFFKNNTEVHQMQEELIKYGVPSEAVTGDSDREAQLERFHAGEVNVVLNCMVLTEGFDCPDLRTVFCRPSGKGPTIQMAGRVFRKYKGLPYKQVVQCTDTRWPMPRTATPLVSHLLNTNGVWESLETNERLDEIGEISMRAIAQINVELPKFLTDKERKVTKLRYKTR